MRKLPPLSRFVTDLFRALRDPELQGLGLFVLILLLAGTIFYSLVEHWNAVDALYHSAMILTTIGSSDLTPSTPLSKLFTVVYVFLGLGSVLGFVALFAGHIHRRPPKS